MLAAGEAGRNAAIPGESARRRLAHARTPPFLPTEMRNAGAGWSLHVGSLRHVSAYWQAHRDPGHAHCGNCPLTLRVWNSTQAVILSRVTGVWSSVDGSRG